MSIVYHHDKRSGITYAYESKSYWDREKGQSRAKRRLIGRVDDETGEIVPAIVDEELWDKANEVLRRRSEDVKSRQGICNHANLLTGKLYCTCCGQPYSRRESKDRKGNKNSKWICSGKIKNGADSCPSFPIYEEEIKPVLFSVFGDTQSSAEAMSEEYIRLYNEQTDGGTLPQKIAAQQKIIDAGLPEYCASRLAVGR